MSELVLYMALLLSGIVGSYLKRVAFLYVPYRPLYIMYMQARAYADVQGTFPILHSQFPVFNSLVTTAMLCVQTPPSPWPSVETRGRPELCRGLPNLSKVVSTLLMHAPC